MSNQFSIKTLLGVVFLTAILFRPAMLFIETDFAIGFAQQFKFLAWAVLDTEYPDYGYYRETVRTEPFTLVLGWAVGFLAVGALLLALAVVIARVFFVKPADPEPEPEPEPGSAEYRMADAIRQLRQMGSAPRDDQF